MNATDVIGWGWGLGKDSWKPLCTNKKRKGLGCFQCVNILGGAQPGGRQSFQSLRRGGWRARCPVLPGGRGSLQPRGGWGCGSPRRGASRPRPGPRSGGGAAGCGAGTGVRHAGARGVCKAEATLRSPFSPRLPAGPRPTCCPPGRGNRACRFGGAFSRLSPGTPAAPPWGAREGRVRGLFPPGPPGSSHPVGEAVGAEGVRLGDPSSPEGALRLRPLRAPRCAEGQRRTPGGPRPWSVPTAPAFGPEPAPGEAKSCPPSEPRASPPPSSPALLPLRPAASHRGPERCRRAGKGGEELLLDGGKCPSVRRHLLSLQSL